MEFTAETRHIPQARHWVLARAREEGAVGDVLDVLALLATEAVANAVRHGPPGGTVRVRVDRYDGLLRVGVADDGDGTPVVRLVEPTELAGRGMALIDMLAHAWGVEPHRDGKTVWFEVPLA